MKRLPILILAAGLAACGGGNKPVPPFRDAAPSPIPAVQQARPDPDDKRPVIVAFGDSISAGYGVEPGKSYPDDIQRLIDGAGYKYRVVNMGVSGDTTTDGLERLPSVIALHPAIVIVEFGGNDGLRGQPVSGAKANLARIIDGVTNAGAIVILAGMTLPRNYGPEYIDSFDRIYRELSAEKKVTLIPFVLDGVGGNPALTQADGLHPTAEGAQLVAQNVMKYLKPLLRRTP